MGLVSKDRMQRRESESLHLIDVTGCCLQNRWTRDLLASSCYTSSSELELELRYFFEGTDKHNHVVISSSAEVDQSREAIYKEERNTTLCKDVGVPRTSSC